MKLGDKLRSLRSVEGQLRGFDRPMTQVEVARAMQREVGRGLSQAYLSQIESGLRPHITHTTRELLARFFRVYPGFLVDDPEGYSAALQSDLRVLDAKVDSWLFAGAEQFSSDAELRDALLELARHEDSRRLLLLLGEIVRTPGLADRLGEVLRPETLERDGNDRKQQSPEMGVRS
jgi:transcriptional regulator with XRE-family HTH domain